MLYITVEKKKNKKRFYALEIPQDNELKLIFQQVRNKTNNTLKSIS